MHKSAGACEPVRSTQILPAMEAHTCHPWPHEAEAGEVQGQPELRSKTLISKAEREEKQNEKRKSRACTGLGSLDVLSGKEWQSGSEQPQMALTHRQSGARAPSGAKDM